MKRVKEFLKAMAIIGALIVGVSAALSFADAHAELNIHVKQMPAPPKYLVDGKETNAAEATLAVLQGKKAMKCTEMEVEAGRNGLSLKSKKAN